MSAFLSRLGYGTSKSFDSNKTTKRKLGTLLENKMNHPLQFETDVNLIASSIVDMLIEKNRKYGDSALNPKRVFSKASPLEQINVRIDDKLSRIANQQSDEDEDVEMDLIGYLILKQVFKAQVKRDSVA